MSAWLIAALALLPPLIAGVACAGRGALARRLLAIQFATSTAVLLFVVLDFAFDQSSSMDLALTLALLSLPGTLLLALFQERWL
ncbi:MAG TPA: monovalent cation/H+ antiporter complex subunit F [Rhodanobacteraceae bacterium]|nr:monovalent cation/H+ antiporter complex subunit F [Rhodanobacteraceae bacterium]